MWESGAQEDAQEFENDFIASTNDIIYTNKRFMQKYESEYYREPVSPVRRHELPPRTLEALHALYQQFSVR